MSGLFDNLLGEDSEEEDGFRQEEADEIDEEFSEAEKLLAKAAYYKAVARAGVVDDDGTPQAAEVNAEARAWAREMMGRMLGRSAAAPPREEVFSESEVRALKRLAGIALAKMGEPNDPVVKRAEAPPVPRVTKVASQQRPAPRAAQQPRKQARTGQKVIKATPKPQKKGDPKSASYDHIPSGQPFQDEEGQTWKWVDNPNYDPSVPKSRARGMIRIDVRQAASNKALPMPQGRQLDAILAGQASQTVNAGVNANQDSDPNSINANKLGR